MFHPEGPTLFELAKQALSSTTDGYDLLAPKFEHTPFRTPDELLQPFVNAVRKEPVLDFLDLACGTGAIARKVAPFVQGRTIGIDISPGMLAEGRTLARAEGVEVIFQEMDLFDMRFHEQFDVVGISGAFGHILEPDLPKFVELVFNALKPGGRFIFITGPMPPKTEPAYWMLRGFNAAMHVRNALIQPPFIMFYLTFTLEHASDLLLKQGFDVCVESPFTGPLRNQARLVTARKPL